MATDEVFNFGPVPAGPQMNVTATYAELKSSPQLYFEESFLQNTKRLIFVSNWFIGRRHRLDDGLVGSGFLHDSGTLSSLLGHLKAAINAHAGAAAADHDRRCRVCCKCN
jgi:hypothetical protein